MKYIKLFEKYNLLILKIELEKYDIENYTINDDGTIDVDGDVSLDNIGRDSGKLPFKFGKITGGFDCSYNNLDSLEGCPKEVGGDFDCSNNFLYSLDGGPTEVGGSYDCSYNELTSLKGCPSEIGGDFNCSDNNLNTLQYCPSEIKRNLNCSSNQLLDLDCSSIIGRDIICYYNAINPNKYNFYGEVKGKIICSKDRPDLELHLESTNYKFEETLLYKDIISLNSKADDIDNIYTKINEIIDENSFIQIGIVNNKLIVTNWNTAISKTFTDEVNSLLDFTNNLDESSYYKYRTDSGDILSCIITFNCTDEELKFIQNEVIPYKDELSFYFYQRGRTNNNLRRFILFIYTKDKIFPYKLIK